MSGAYMHPGSESLEDNGWPAWSIYAPRLAYGEISNAITNKSQT